MPRRSPMAWPRLLGVLALAACSQMPPPRVLEPAHLPHLQGRWEGRLAWSAADGSTGWPVVLRVADDGTFTGEGGGAREVALRGTLRVEAGRVAIEAGPYAGVLTYHGGDGRRALAGELQDTRPGRGAYASTYLLHLERPVEAARTDAGPPIAPVDAVQTLAWPRPALTGTYAGRVTGDDNGRLLTAGLTVTLVQERIDVTGTWVVAGETAGTLSGRVTGPGLLRLRFRQVEPCVAELLGEASTGEGGQLAGHYAGPGCGGPVSGVFSLVRQ